MENNKLSFAIADNRLVITNTLNDYKLIVKNYKNIKYIKTDVIGKNYNLFNIISENLVDNSANVISNYHKKKLTVSGTNYNDKIDVSLSDYTPKGKTNIKKNKGLTINGGNGNDTIIGTDYNDVIKGGNGFDTINAGRGNNSIYFYKGGGADIIENGNGVDTLVFAKKTNLTYSYDKYDLIIKYSDNDTVTLKDYLKGHSVKYVQIGTKKTAFNPSKPQVNQYQDGEYTVFEGAEIVDTITGTTGKDKIFGNDGSDTITAGKGNDIIDGGSGNNRFVFNTGDGNDTILNGEGEDTIQFTSAQTLTYSKNLNSNDLIIGYGNNDTVTLKDYFVNNSHSAKTILNNGQELNIADKIAEGITINGTTSSETILGTIGDDIIYPNGGQDIVINSGGNDTIQYSTIQKLNYSHNLVNDDLIISYSDDNSICLKDYFVNNSHSVNTIKNDKQVLTLENEITKGMTIYGTTYSENITGTEGSDIIKSMGGVDTITANRGDDKIYAGVDNSTLIFNVGDGKDEIYSGTGEDTIKLNGVEFDDLSYKKLNNDLIIKYSDNDSITLKDYFITEHSVKNITVGNGNDKLSNKIKLSIEGTNNSEIITGTDCDDIIIAKGGNDLIYGGKGNNTYIFNVCNGNNTIMNGEGNDTIELTGFDYLLRYDKSINNNDLIITYFIEDILTPENYFKITLKDYFLNNSHSVKTIKNGNKIISLDSAISSTENFYYTYSLNLDDTTKDNIYATNSQCFGDYENNIIMNNIQSGVYGGFGDDIIINDGCRVNDRNDETVNYSSSPLKGDYGNDIIISNINTGSIQGGDCSDILIRNDNSYSVNGGRGNDIIFLNANSYSGDYSGYGNDFIIFAEQYTRTGNYFSVFDNDTLYIKKSIELILGHSGEYSYPNKVTRREITHNSSDAVYRWQENDIVITYNNGCDSLTIKNYDPSDNSTQIRIGDTNIATLVPEKPQASSIAKVGLTDLKLIADYDEYFTFIPNSENNNTTYEVGLDKKYDIMDALGEDVINIRSNSTVSDLNILFNVNSSYRITDGIEFGKIDILENKNIENWKAKNTFKEIVVENNSVETINFNNKTISSSDIAQLAEKVAIWLTDDGRDYACVNAVLNSGNTTDINNLITYFADNTNWQTIE